MTIQNNPTRNQYTATSGQTVFNYNFEIISTGDISVFKGDTRLAISTDYTLTGVGNESGGTVTLVVGATTGDIITIYRSTAQERLTDYQNSGDFLSDEVNSDFDRIWAVIQEIDGGQGRYLQLSDTTTASLPVTLDDPIASQILRWKDDSSGVESVSLSAISPGSSVATDFCIYKTNYNEIRSIDVSKVVDGQTLTVTDEGIGGQGVLRNVVGHGVTDNGGTIIVIDANWYWERIYSGAVNVKWFGAVGDGVVDDASAIQSAINLLGNIYAPAGVYLVTAPLTFSGETVFRGANRRGGAGTTRILAAHTGNSILDTRGFTHNNISDLELTTDTVTFPKTGILCGRTSAASSGHHNFNYIKIQGYFSVAAIYSIASEVNTWSDIYVWNLGTNDAKYCFYTSKADDLGVGGLTTSTNLVCTFTSAYFINNSTDPDSACIYMESYESMGSWNWFSPYLIPYAGAYVHINNDTDSQALGPYGFYGLSGERLAGGDPMYGVRITASTFFSLNGLTITGSRLDLNALNQIGGSDDTSTAAAFMTDSSASFTVNALVNMIIENNTDGSYALITSNTATTVTGTLRGVSASSKVWNSGDSYSIYDKYQFYVDFDAVLLKQPNIVMQQPEAFPYPMNKFDRKNIQGGIFSVGREGLWTNATLLNGWSNGFGAPASPAGYTVSPDGNVQLRGLVSSGAGTILTLPREVRPKFNEYFATQGNGSSARLLITAATGALTLETGSGPQVSLSAVSYKVSA